MNKQLVANRPGEESIAGEQVSGLLRRALFGNAAFSSIIAVVCILGARPIASWLGIASPVVLVVLGVSILIFVPYLLWVATRRPLNRSAARLILWLDVAWVVASPFIVLLNPFSLTEAGQWAVGVVSLIVLDFAVMEYVGLRRIERAATYRTPG
jgi:hypothetical protein